MNILIRAAIFSFLAILSLTGHAEAIPAIPMSGIHPKVVRYSISDATARCSREDLWEPAGVYGELEVTYGTYGNITLPRSYLCREQTQTGYINNWSYSSDLTCPTGTTEIRVPYPNDVACNGTLYTCPSVGKWILSADKQTCTGCWDVTHILNHNNACVGEEDKELGSSCEFKADKF